MLHLGKPFARDRPHRRIGQRSGRRSLFLIDANLPGIVRRDYPTVDGFQASEVYFENVAIPGDALLGGEGAGLPLIEQIVDEATVSVCAEACGVTFKLHQGTLEYARQRNQFGQPISRFQVLQHRMVDMFMEVEQSKSMTTMATLKLDLPAAERMAAVSACKAKVSRGRQICRPECRSRRMAVSASRRNWPSAIISNARP